MCHISFNSITNQTNQSNPIFLLKQIITKRNIREMYVSIYILHNSEYNYTHVQLKLMWNYVSLKALMVNECIKITCFW
jgi:hypothetical protein